MTRRPVLCLDVDGVLADFVGGVLDELHQRTGRAHLREVADVTFVTSPMRGEHWRPERQAWLQRHFGAARGDVVQVKDKHVVPGDILVDDKADNVRKWKWSKLVGRRRGLLWDTHHNRADADLDGVRVQEWREVYELVREMGRR